MSSTQSLLLRICLPVFLILGVGFSFASLSTSNLSKATLERKYTNEASKFMHVDGNRVHYRDEGNGPTLVLLHGTASSLHTWDAWVEDLKGEYRIIRMDLPGFGLTGPDSSDRYQVSDDVRFLSTVLEKLDAHSIHLAGSSLGGRIAWQYALEHPKHVKSLTLIDALGYPQTSWPPAIQLAQWPVFDTVMTHISPRFMYKQGLSDVYHQPQQITEVLVDRYFELSRYPGNMAAFPKRVKARLDQDAHLIPSITTPTLVLWGEQDKYFPVENARRFVDDMPNAVAHTYANVGHLPMEEAAQQSLRDFKSFIARN